MAAIATQESVARHSKSMVFRHKQPPTARFVVFRTIESFVFAAPSVFVHLRAGHPESLVALAISAVSYAIWTWWFKRRLSRADVEAYEVVYGENDKTRVYKLSDLNPAWTTWLVFVGVIIYVIVF